MVCTQGSIAFLRVADCGFQDETLILTAAGLGHPQVVEMLIKATTGITEGDAKVCHIGSITIFYSGFAFLVIDNTPLRPLNCAALVAICSVSHQCKKLFVCLCNRSPVLSSSMSIFNGRLLYCVG